MGSADGFERLRGMPEISGNGAEEYYLRTQFWQSELDLAAMRMSPEDFHDLGVQIIDELDKLCPYFGEMVVMSGHALLPAPEQVSHDLDDDEDRPVSHIAILARDDDEDTVYAKVDNILGIHQGTVIHLIEEGGQEGEPGWRIRQAVVISTTSFTEGKGTRTGQRTLMGFFEIDSDIISVEDIDPALAMDHDMSDIPEEALQGIDFLSEYLAYVLKSKWFRGLPHARQRDIVNEVIEEAEQLAPIRNRGVLVGLRPKYKRPNRFEWPGYHVYVTDIGENGPIYRRQTIIGNEIGGLCLGLTSLELPTVNQRPIRKPASLRAPKAGLCLVIDPDEQTALKIGSDRVVLVSISEQDFDAAFE